MSEAEVSEVSGAEESEADQNEERRRERRVDVEFPVRFQVPTPADGEVLELSKSGLRAEVGEDLSHVLHVSLEFELPSGSRPIRAIADVRWHKQIGPKSDPRWLVGLRFSDITETDQSAISDFIDRQMVEPDPDKEAAE